MLVEACTKLEIIQIHISYKKTISRAIEMFLEMQKIQLLEGDVWGHRKDLNEYYTMPPSIMTEIKNMKGEGIPNEKIVEKIAKERRLNPKMNFYILNRRQYE
jgi:hypothetical protein